MTFIQGFIMFVGFWMLVSSTRKAIAAQDWIRRLKIMFAAILLMLFCVNFAVWPGPKERQIIIWSDRQLQQSVFIVKNNI